MLSLARSSLVHEFYKYIPAILAVSFASLLLLMQIALVLGLFGLITSVVDRSSADIWLTSPYLQSFDQAVDIPSRLELDLRMRPEVKRTELVRMVNAQVRTPGGTLIAATLVGYDVRPGSFVMPGDFRPDLAEALRMPGGIVIDAADAPKLGATVGTVLEINGRRAPVVGLTHNFRGVGGVYVFTSFFNASFFGGGGTDLTTFVAGQTADPAAADDVCRQLQSTGENRTFDAWTSKGLSRHTRLYWLLETGMGVGVLFSALVGVVVGVVITSQTLRSVIITSLKEYATLRAMGVSVAALRLIVLEMAGWIGALGLTCTGIVEGFLAEAGEHAQVSLYFPWWAIAVTVIFTFAVAFASGFFALRALYAAEPAQLLR